MELRHVTSGTLVALHILLFLKSHVLVISGHSVIGDQGHIMELDQLHEGDDFPGNSGWEKPDGTPDKKWKEMAVWGKRSEFPDKKWKEMAVWGKRDGVPNKKWKEMADWRNNEDMTNKLQKDPDWENTDGIPDKKWKEMAVWGKRSEYPDKKWKEMAVWGKRSEYPDKKWKEMAVWGKRDNKLRDKKWKEMPVWGKRSAALNFSKKWKSMPVWGKRSFSSAQPWMHFRSNRNWIDSDSPWRKRHSWRRTGFKSWGKRSSLSGQESRFQERQLPTQEERIQQWLHDLQGALLTQGQGDLGQGEC